jgi:hypothetical protein
MDLKSFIQIENEEYIISTIKEKYKFETKVFKTKYNLGWNDLYIIGETSIPAEIYKIYNKEYDIEEEAIEGHDKIYYNYLRNCFSKLTDEEFKQKLISEGYEEIVNIGVNENG